MLPKKETETVKQIKQGLSGVAEGLAALFARDMSKANLYDNAPTTDPDEYPGLPKRKRPTIPMKYVEEGTEGQWDAPEPSWKDEEDSDYRVHPAGRYVGSTRSKGSRQELDAGHQHEGHTQR